METKKKADDTVIIADEDLDEKTEEDVYDVLLCELRGFVKSEKELITLNKKNYEQED